MSDDTNIPTTSLASTSSYEISIWKPSDGFWGELVVDLRSKEEVWKNIRRAWATGVAQPAHGYSFIDYDDLQKTLTPNRMGILRIMMGHGPASIREIARRVSRDFKGVHSDVTLLIKVGILYKTEDGRIVFPYDRIRFDFLVGGERQAAA